MPSYNENYVYSVQVTGAAQAIAQLRELQQAANGVKGGSGTIGTGSAAASGAADGDAYGKAFGSTVQRAMTNVLVYGAIGAGIGAIISGATAWKDANIALSDSLAELQVKLGVTQKQAETYYATMQQAAFATGQDVQEATYAKTIEQRVNRPGLSSAGLEFGLVFPEVPVQDAVGNLLALQIQFGASFGEINEVLLDTVQASGLAANQLLNLSDTWGPLSQELGMLDENQQRYAGGMRDISGLMAGMATVMGESGSTIENFLRKMSQFYTNDDIKAFLAQRNIETTTGKTASGLDIRVPFMELMNQISAQAKAEAGFAVGLQEFFPNQLGQPTQQQLQELIRNWDTINGIIRNSSDTAVEWGTAVDASSQRISVAIERISSAFQGLVAAIGGDDRVQQFLNSLASGIQNQVTRISGPPKDYVNALDVMSSGRYNFTGREEVENFLEAKSGDNWLRRITEKRAKEILQNFSIPKELASNENAAYNYTFGAVKGFANSDFFDPKENGAAMAASFIEYINSSSFNEDVALKTALAGGGVSSVSQAATATYSTAPIDYTPWSAPMSVYVEDSMDAVALSAVNASYSVDALSAAAAGASGALNVFTMQRVDIGDASVAQIVGQYERDKLAGKRFAQQYGLDYSITEEPVALFRDGKPVGKINADVNIVKDSTGTVTEQNRAAEALAKKNQAAAEAAANKANAAAEARAKRLESLFDSMFSAITKPTSVTASDLMYNAPGGKYQNKWDEPVRQMRADVNNLIAGKDLEYGFGGGTFSSIFEPGILGFAQGADQETKAAIMKDLQAQAEKAYYSFTLPQDAYAGSKDALIASAQDWVAGKKNEKANKAMMKGWLTEAGLGPEAMGFLDEMDEPPILKMLTGGKTKEEMTTLLGDKIPNVSTTLAKGASEVAWIAIIGTAITTQAKEDPGALIGAGQAMGGWLAKGSASTFVAVIVPEIIAAVLAGL